MSDHKVAQQSIKEATLRTNQHVCRCCIITRQCQVQMTPFKTDSGSCCSTGNCRGKCAMQGRQQEDSSVPDRRRRSSNMLPHSQQQQFEEQHAIEENPTPLKLLLGSWVGVCRDGSSVVRPVHSNPSVSHKATEQSKPSSRKHSIITFPSFLGAATSTMRPDSTLDYEKMSPLSSRAGKFYSRGA